VVTPHQERVFIGASGLLPLQALALHARRDEASHTKVGVGIQAKGTDHGLGEAESVPGWRPWWASR
jgi:hypothetical protein